MNNLTLYQPQSYQVSDLVCIGVEDFSIQIEEGWYREKYCDCEIHDNELLKQVSGYLVNGEPIKISKDHYGYHMAVGVDSIRSGICPPMSKDQLIEVIIDCLGW